MNLEFLGHDSLHLLGDSATHPIEPRCGTLAALVRELKPFLWAHGAILMVITFVPALSTWLPRALGFK